MANILVADDVKDIRDLLKAILEQEDHTVVEADTGKKVLSLLQEKEHTFDLILLDIGFPDIDGTAVMQEISEMEGEQPKVCFVSGKKDRAMITKALQAGGSDYIVKPIDILVLKNKLSKFLGDGEDNTLTIETDLVATLPELPMEIEVTITSLSELGLSFTAAMPFKEKTTINLSSYKINSLSSNAITLACTVDSSKEDKKTHIYTVKCSFAGMHENQRSQLRKLVIAGKKISDKAE